IGIITRIWKGGIYESLDKVKQWRFDDAEGPTAGKEDEITHSTLDYFGRRTIVLQKKNTIDSTSAAKYHQNKSSNDAPSSTDASSCDVYVAYNVPFLYKIHKPFMALAVVAFIVFVYRISAAFFNWVKIE
ncbi:MAG: hypothetical protein EZS28_018480, partial [Streblomastix strix]